MNDSMIERPILAKYRCLCWKQISKYNRLRICLDCKEHNDPNDAEFRRKLHERRGRRRRGEEHFRWKGEGVGYHSLHNWIRRELGTATYCSNDDTHKTRIYEWANISGTYKRDINDYKPLCTSCHRKRDMTNAKREAVSKRFRGVVHSSGKKRAVYQYTLDGIFINKYQSMSEASRKLGIGVSTIGNNLSGFRKSGGGFLWKTEGADI